MSIANVDLHELLTGVIDCVYQTGDFIRSCRNRVSQEDIEVKEINSLVSYVDKTAEQKLVAVLTDLCPSAGFITEENTVTQSGKEWTWIIDPLDGTTNFLHDIPIFSISVALAFQGEVVLGVVYEVVRDEMFTAITGKGAKLNGKEIRVTNETDVANIVVATGYPYAKENLFTEHFTVLRKVLESTRGIRRLGTAAVDLCYVACGRFGMYYEMHLNPWDVAAGGLIVKESGGVVTDLEGKHPWLSGKSILAYGSGLESGVMSLIWDFRNELTGANSKAFG